MLSSVEQSDTVCTTIRSNRVTDAKAQSCEHTNHVVSLFQHACSSASHPMSDTWGIATYRKSSSRHGREAHPTPVIDAN